MEKREGLARTMPSRFSPFSFHCDQKRQPLGDRVAVIFPMEAQGIEPWSESASETASTCVCSVSSLAWARYRANRSHVDLPRISGLTWENRQPLARIFDPKPTPRTGFGLRRSVKRALAQLTQPLPVQSWQLNHSKIFYQGLGPGHAAMSSTNPSKPVAPGIPKIIEPKGKCVT